MTIVLKETTAVNQTLLQGGPDFQGRALLAYGHNRGDHGVVSGRQGPAAWGFQTELDALYGAIGFSITNVGSLETGGSRMVSPGANFFASILGGPSVPQGVLALDFFGCGEVGIVTGSPQSTYLGLFVLGGVTLESAVGIDSFSGTGPKSITGLGFQPDLILMGGVSRTTTGGPDATPEYFGLSYGAADSTGSQFACAVGSRYLSGTSIRTSRTVNNACHLQLVPATTIASLTSMDSDGFTLDCTTFGGTELFWWVAIKDPGGQFAVGTATEGDSSFTPGFTPEAAMFASVGNTAFGTSQAGAAVAFGGADSSGAQYAGWEAAAAANVFSRNYWSTKAISLVTHPTGLVSAPTAEADVTSWGSSVGLNWTTGGTNGLKFGWVAMKTSKGPGFAGCGSVRPQIYRLLKK